MTEPEEVIRQYRDGDLTAEAAAELLLPSLQKTGKLELELSEADMPVLAALQQLAKPRLPAAQPLVWESRSWQALEGLADSFWPQIQQHGLDQIPQCLNYVFMVGSNIAAEQLTQRIESSSDHSVMTDLPSDYEKFVGRVFGQTQPAMLTHPGLVQWSGWLRGFSPVPDAMLEKIHVSGPPAPPPKQEE
jgi:hypothetical protein